MSKPTTPIAFAWLPGRLLMKNSQCPSREMLGLVSSAVELTMAPRLVGAPQAAVTLSRWENQRSMLPPSEPDLLEPKYSLSPSLESVGPASLPVELMTG